MRIRQTRQKRSRGPGSGCTWQLMLTQPALGGLPLMLVCLLGAAVIAEAGVARYVDTRNTYNGNGLSGGEATSNGGPGAFNNVASAKALTYALGDDLYFTCDSVISNELVLSRSRFPGGTANDPSVIGAYYMNGSTPVIGISSNRPLFLGSKTEPFVPTNPNNGLITVSAYSVSDQITNVVIQDLEANTSYGIGIVMAYVSRGAIRNCKVSYTMSAGIAAVHANQDVPVGTTVGGLNLSLIESNDVSHVNEEGGARTTGILASYSRHCLIQYNYVHENYDAEGIGTYTDGGHTIQYNRIWDNLQVALYPAGVSYVLVRGNHVANTGSNPRYAFTVYNGRRYGGNFSIVNEAGDARDVAYATHDIWVYDNLFGPGLNTGIWYGGSEWTRGQDALSNIKIFNNTVVGNKLTINGIWWALADGTGNEIKNNIFWRDDPATQDSIAKNLYAGICDYNLWSEIPMTEGRGPHDPPYAAPLLRKASGWNNVTLDGVTAADFMLRAGSPAIGKGVTLGSPFNLDYFGGQRLSALGWDIGAHEYPQFAAPGVSGGQMRLTWAGSGRLEWAPEIQGPWTPFTPAPSSPYADPMNPGTNRFYRLNATP